LLNREVGHGEGVALMTDVSAGLFRPSQKVVERLDAVLRHDAEWHLLVEQRKAYNAIWAEVQRRRRHSKRSAVLVRGGPGTGKSVIAVQLLAEALKSGLIAAHSTGGKAFTLVLQGMFTSSKPVFIWNRSLRNAKPLELVLLLADEAHRIRETSDDRFTPRNERNRRAQIDEMLDSAKVSVFLLDEHQYMRPDEIGNSMLVREATARRSIPLQEFDLATQFRCGGSRDYVAWIDYLLGFTTTAPLRALPRRTPSMSQATPPDDLDVFMETAPDRDTARLVAGFCWRWSDAEADGALVDDVVIGDWRRPWNRKPNPNKQYKPDAHPYTLWATTPERFNQVGCIYSAQGFEFDRVGVIWGHDLVWRNGRWVGQKRENKDPGLRRASGDDITRLIRNAYRVLLTRGMKRTMVLCLDAETRAHLIALSRSREDA
jgi:uncharacterized protein